MDVNTFNYVTDVEWGHSEGDMEKERERSVWAYFLWFNIICFIFFLINLTRSACRHGKHYHCVLISRVTFRTQLPL